MNQEREIMYIEEIELLAEAVKALPEEYYKRNTMLELFEDVNPNSNEMFRVVVANRDLPAMIFNPQHQEGGSAWEVIELDQKEGVGVSMERH